MHPEDYHAPISRPLPDATSLGAGADAMRAQRVGYPDRALSELEYARNWSLGRDLRIILRMPPAVLAARGAH